MAAINDDTAYGPALFATALSASFLLVVAAVVLGVTIARAESGLRPYGIAYATLITLFVAGIAVPVVQPFAGFGLAVATALPALRLRHDPRAQGRDSRASAAAAQPVGSSPGGTITRLFQTSRTSHQPASAGVSGRTDS
jgi:hypothetical protein